MASSFSIIGMLLENARKAEARQTAERPKTAAQRERERAELRRDMAEGAAMAREFAARQAAEADPEAAYLAHCKAQALKIINAGRAVRGQAPLERLMQDEDAEDKPSKPRDRGDGDENTNDDEKRRGNPMSGESVAQYWDRVHSTAAAIVRAGQRRRGEIQ